MEKYRISFAGGRHLSTRKITRKSEYKLFSPLRIISYPIYRNILFLQLWSVIEQVLLEDLSQDSFDKKTPNVKQKVFLERRTQESRGEDCLKHPCKTIQPDLESFESFEEERLKSVEGVDLDCYLQEELDKHEQNETQEGGEERKTKSSRRIKGRCLPVARCRQILPKQRAESPATPEPKKVFRCNINNCSKTYVKSSHLKVTNTDILAPWHSAPPLNNPTKR